MPNEEEFHKEVQNKMLFDVLAWWEKLRPPSKLTRIEFLRSVADDYEHYLDWHHERDDSTEGWSIFLSRDGWYAQNDLMYQPFSTWPKNMRNFCKLLRETADLMEQKF